MKEQSCEVVVDHQGATWATRRSWPKRISPRLGGCCRGTEMVELVEADTAIKVDDDEPRMWWSRMSTCTRRDHPLR